jgi:hypothetical protein
MTTLIYVYQNCNQLPLWETTVTYSSVHISFVFVF